MHNRTSTPFPVRRPDTSDETTEQVRYRGYRGQLADSVRPHTIVHRGDEPLKRREDLLPGGGDTQRNWGRSASLKSRQRLAVDLLADALGDDDERVLELYELVAEKLVRWLGRNEWVLTDRQLLDAVEGLDRVVCGDDQ